MPSIQHKEQPRYLEAPDEKEMTVTVARTIFEGMERKIREQSFVIISRDTERFRIRTIANEAQQCSGDPNAVIDFLRIIRIIDGVE